MSQKKIIIIGAGIAGLAAGTRLLEHGFDVLLLEARDRCGGRISTDNKLGIPIGRGAGWIHGIEHNPITALAQRFHAKMLPADTKHYVRFDRHGNSIPLDVMQAFDTKFDALLEQAKKLADEAKHDLALATVLTHLMKSEKFSSVEWDLFETKLRFFEGYIGAGYEFLSARHWDQEETWPGENCFLTNSYQPIIAGLSKNCPLQLNTVVTKINLRKNDVEIITENTSFYANAVIITLPLGVLQKNVVKFNPPLPDDKQKAIERLGMGLLDITAIKFPRIFWPEDSQAMFFTQFDTLSVATFFNTYRFTEQPILLGYYGGERARQLENFSDEKFIAKIKQNFQTFFGKSLPEPESYFITRWSQDPFSYGSYSYIPPGASCADYEAIGKPIANRLFFAGEATCANYLATTHGAYLSGIREADRIKSLYVDI